MAKIFDLHAREILDSRGFPTIEVFLSTETVSVRSSVPSGASVGATEAHELRDEDSARYGGKGVLHAVNYVSGEIFDAVKGKEFDQAALDAFLMALDGTPNKSRLGANALLGVSLAFARASAEEQLIPLYQYLGTLGGYTTFTVPQPCFNVLNGGKHADSGLSIQEFMLIPVGFPTASRKIEAAAAVIAKLKGLLIAKGFSVGVGDEGGFAPKLASNEAALDVLVEAILAAGYTTDQVKIGLDVAASEQYKNGAYVFDARGPIDATAVLEWYAGLLEHYPIISIEDGFFEEDWAGFEAFTARFGAQIRTVGDDLLTTNVARINTAASHHAVNTALIKPNQVGTVSETIAAMQAARGLGWALFASHRSGETVDSFIVDLAVGFSCEYLKVGSLARGERVSKYNRLMEIESELTK